MVETIDHGLGDLEEAARVYFDYIDRGRPESRSAFLARHEGVRDLLESMLDESIAFFEFDDDREVPDLELELPYQLDEFTLEREIGRGGMGIVYEAWDRNLDRKVALKLMSKTLALNPLGCERFIREAKMAARVSSDRVCRVFDSGECSQGLFIAMELVEGIPLSSYVESGASLSTPPPDGVHVSPSKTGNGKRRSTERKVISPPSASKSSSTSNTSSDPARSLAEGGAKPRSESESASEATTVEGVALPVATYGAAVEIDRAVEIVEACARGLQAAHDKNVVHRDIKPSNIMIRPNGDPVILDFGLAFEDDDFATDRFTESGVLIGSPPYMSPEQIEGDIDAIGSGTDIYALGIVLYELLTGTKPYSADGRRKLYAKILTGEPTRVRARVASISRDLEAVCLKAMNRDRERRFPTAAAFADDLVNVRNGVPTSTRPLNFVQRLGRKIDRRPGLAVAIMAAAGALIVAFVMWHDRGTIERDRNTLEEKRVVLDDAVEISQFYVWYIDYFEQMKASGRDTFTDQQKTHLEKLAADDLDANLLVRDPGRRAVEVRIRRRLQKVERARDPMSRAGLRPHHAITTSRPEFVMVRPSDEWLAEARDFAIRIRVAKDGRLTGEEFFYPVHLDDSVPEGLVSYELPEGVELPVGDYEWHLVARKEPNPREPWRSRPSVVGPILVFRVAPQEELDRVLATVPTTSTPELEAMLKSVALLRAGFALEAERLARVHLTDPTSPLYRRTGVVKGAISVFLGDLKSARRRFDSARPRQGHQK